MQEQQHFLDKCSYGLYVITSCDGEKLNGQISDALIQVTATPARVAVSICTFEYTHEMIIKSKVFGVSVLSTSADLKFIGNFGFRSGRDFDKFKDVKYQFGTLGCPLLLENTTAHFEVKVIKTIDLGTHTLFIGDVQDGKIVKDTDVLTYCFYKEHLKGKPHKNSPSYRE